MTILYAAAAGICSGAVTTVAGLGGGLILVLILAALFDPKTALALSTPALALANLHRIRMYRRVIDRPEARRLAIGGFVGAAAGGLLTAALPDAVIRWLMIGTAALALLRFAGLRWAPPDAASAPAAALTGLISATSGGGGSVLGPYLLARGHSGPGYVATAACCALAIHLGKIASYSASGVSDGRTLAGGVALAAAVAAGNLLGDRARRVMGVDRQRRLQVAVMVACVGLAVLGS